jgi:hypothetical protein
MINEYFLGWCPKIVALASEGIEVTDELPPNPREFETIHHLVGRAGTKEVFRHLLCLACNCTGEVADPACGGACEELHGWGSCMCPRVNHRTCPRCDGMGYKEGRWTRSTAWHVCHTGNVERNAALPVAGADVPLGQLSADAIVEFYRFEGEHYPEWWSLRLPAPMSR